MEERQKNFAAFTLVEILIVIAIIGLLVSILTPSLIRARKLAQQVACASNLRSLGAAAALYQAEFGEYVPICWRNVDENQVNPWPSWRMGLLPYTGGVATFNCSGAKDAGPLSEVIHSASEMASRTEKYGTANAGSYGVMYQESLPSYETEDVAGVVKQGQACDSLAFSTVPGLAWRDPANSVYIADAYLAKGPVSYPTEGYKNNGTSAVVPPSDPDHDYFDAVGVTRRFADRHFGTNCLFVGGRVEMFVTKELDDMVAGSADCIWDVE